jgi:hypothetical protein
MIEDFSLKHAFKTTFLGYAMIVGSALILTATWRLATGYLPSFTLFTMGLLTLRLVEIHTAFILAPLIVSTFTLTLLSKTNLNERFASGLSLSAYYILTTLAFLFRGAGEFFYGITSIWILMVFILGYVSSAIVRS